MLKLAAAEQGHSCTTRRRGVPLVLLKSASVLRIALGALETNALPAIESSHHGEASSAPAARASPRVVIGETTRTKTAGEARRQGRSTNDRGAHQQSA